MSEARALARSGTDISAYLIVDSLHTHTVCKVSRFGLAVRREAGKQKGLGSTPLWLSFLLKKLWFVDTVW